MNDQSPRVLLVLMAKVMAADAGNLLIRSQFGDWPRDRLAQIYASGDPAGQGDFCGRSYRLQAGDRLLGSIFQRLRSTVTRMVALSTVEARERDSRAGFPTLIARIMKQHVGNWLIRSGLWEVIFHVRVSREMAEFIENFAPDVIYCQGYSLGFAELPVLIARRFNLPICFQTMDDWPDYTYRRSPIGWLLRRSTRELVAKANARLAFGDQMRRCFDDRYGVAFQATYHLDEPSRFFPEPGWTTSEECRIVYTGSLGLRRFEAVQDLVMAVRTIGPGPVPFKIVVYSAGVPTDLPRFLLDAPEVALLPLPSHEELPAVLASASVLFLPESFTVPRSQIALSISTKAHLYIMSGRPVLAYGPPYSGTVRYAVEGGWAATVTERSQTSLADALLRVASDASLRAALSQNARICAITHHDIRAGRARFRSLLVGHTERREC